jgi:hypothetical protein
MKNIYIQKQIEDFLDGADFSTSELKLTTEETNDWVRMRSNPWRFHPQIFIGTWADPKSHPSTEPIRILRIMTGPDEITRAIARQGKHLYCYPWM